jgi:hypothetical protein
LRRNGNLVLHQGKRVLWATGTNTGDYRHRAINLVMQSNVTRSLTARPDFVCGPGTRSVELLS